MSQYCNGYGEYSRLTKKIYYKTRVKKIVTEKNKVTGVILDKTDEFIAGDIIISNADPKQTYGDLLADYSHPKRIQKLLANYKPSLGYFFLCMAVDIKGVEDNTLFNSATKRFFGSYDINAHFDFEKVKDGEGPYFFLSCPNARDKRKITEGTSTLELVSLMPYSYVEKWANLPINKRGEEYEKIKEWYSNRLIARLEIFLPNIRERIIFKVAASPATNYNYTLNTGGAGAGMAFMPHQIGFNRARLKTHIHGLYNVGSGTVYGPGFVRCSKSGWEASKQIIKDFPID